MKAKTKKIVGIVVDIVLIAFVFAMTDHLMLKVIHSENLWLELGIYIVLYGIVFGSKRVILYLWKQHKSIKEDPNRQ